MEVSDRLAAMEEDYNRVSAEYNDIMSKFDREQQMTGNVRTFTAANSYLFMVSCCHGGRWFL